ncbi:MFS transporter [Altererythrobacter salegens]|uniref:MFS transporter n=1 Tax=Croceibacterium salegens TaxID=1737568 RepID=A0A6I4STD9_9SPHN|nr:MFS transporter [Croceibacterium salegens]MXO58789.1 MFS transporter [Croceibacterium salegens]
MATAVDTGMSAAAPSARYQALLVGLLGVNIGIVFLDRTAFGLLAPMIQPEFGLDNAQVGMITGVLAIGWAISSFALPRAADITGKAKLLLVCATVVFSLASISSGLALGFLTMMAARLLMGFAEGGLPPLTFHIVTSEVPPERRGLAVGMTSTIGLQAIPLLGPLVIVGVGTAWGWREAFWVAGVPGLVMAALIWFLIRNPPHERTDDTPKGAIGPLLKVRNIRFSVLLAALNMTCYASLLGFGPLYLVNVAGMDNVTMGAAVTGVGVVGVVCAFIGPMLSDRYGRKPVIFGAYAIAIVGALMMALSNGSQSMVFAGTLIAGAGGAGTGALIMAIIPGESAPSHLRGTAMGFNAGVGEILGAGLMPVVVGMAADRFGLGILPWILAGAGALFCLLTLGLKETAPAVLARRASA